MAADNYRVSYAFTRLTDYALPAFTLNVESGLTTNPAFPTPPVTVADLTLAREEFVAALDATHLGGPIQTIEKNLKKTVLIDKLRLNAAYVQMKAGKDLAALLSSGFSAMSTNRVQVPLGRANIESLLNNVTGQLTLNVVPMLNAKSLEVQKKNGGGWLPAGVFGYFRGIVLPGLTSGQEYSVQVRPVGGSTGYGEWSNPFSAFVT